MAMKRPVMKFNTAKFKEFVKTTPKNYSVVVMFTAMAPQRQCQICRFLSTKSNFILTFQYLLLINKNILGMRMMNLL
jgi:oligosaccharyltransferase complex subunit gamma